jgi:hypothetical protein
MKAGDLTTCHRVSISQLLIWAAEASKIEPVGLVGERSPQHSQRKHVFVIFGDNLFGAAPRYSFLPMLMRLHRLHSKWYTKAKTLVLSIWAHLH